MITYERQKDGTLKQVDSPPKRAELMEQRIYDRCIVRVGQLEAEKATLEARIDELCAEVERLRVANAAFTGRSIRAGDKMACLEAENAKLRELVRDMFGVISRNNTWWDGNAKDTSRLSDRMRELGIEVR